MNNNNSNHIEEAKGCPIPEIGAPLASSSSGQPPQIPCATSLVPGAAATGILASLFAAKGGCNIVGLAGLKFKVLFIVDLTQSVPKELAVKIFPAEWTSLFNVEKNAYKKIKVQSSYTAQILEHGTFLNKSAPRL
jgi:hypothetical protein